MAVGAHRALSGTGARAVAAAVVLAACGSLLAGCGGGSGGGGSSHGGGSALVDELGHVKDTASDRLWVAYGDLAAQRKIEGGEPKGQLIAVNDYGWSTLSGYAQLLPAGFGFDGRKADRVIESGVQPDLGGRFDGGVKPASVAAKEKGMGAKKQGTGPAGDTWRLMPDHQMALNDNKLTKVFGGAPNSSMNVVRTGGSVLVHGPSLAAVDDLDAKGSTLAGNAGFHDVAECLDQPLAAELTARGSGDPMGQAGAGILGVAVRGTSQDHTTQVLCRTAPSAAEAKTLAADLRKRLATGTSAHTGTRWNQLLSGISVKVLGGGSHLVRLTARPGPKGNDALLLQALTTGDLKALLEETSPPR